MYPTYEAKVLQKVYSILPEIVLGKNNELRGAQSFLSSSLASEKIPEFYGIQRFSTMFTSACHTIPCLTQVNPIHAPLPPPNPFV
jgi:hypothetical protein